MTAKSKTKDIAKQKKNVKDLKNKKIQNALPVTTEIKKMKKVQNDSKVGKKKAQKSLPTSTEAKEVEGTKKKVAVPDAAARPKKRNVGKKAKTAKPKVDDKDISSEAIHQAIDGVRILEQHRVGEKTTKDILADDVEDTTVHLQVTMMKLAKFVRGATHLIRPVKIKVFLPNPIVNSNTNVLVIAKDDEDGKGIRDDHTENLHRFEHRFRACGAASQISEVVTLRQLKVEFKEYEAKRNLCNRTDVVLCDDTIVRRVPLFLGKHFYQKRKFPIPINLKSRNLLSQVKQCLSIQILYLPMTGSSGLMKIGRLDQSNEVITENIMAAISTMQRKFPGGWLNVQSIYLKTERSKAVPFYVKIRSANDVLPMKPKPLNNKPVVSGELTSMFGNIYTVLPNNKVVFKTKVYYPVINEEKEKAMKEKETKEKENLAKPKEEAAKLKGKKTTKKQEKRKVSDVDEAAVAKKKASKDVPKDEQPKKKLKLQAKQKKNKKGDLDSEDEDEKIYDLERAYLRQLINEQESEPAAKRKTQIPAVDDDDDWAEMSGDEFGMSDEEEE